MTSKDNYVIPLAMANKVVTKKILDQAGFPVPAGAEFANKTDALRYYGQVASSAIVIKPKSTNFGLGISIFQEPASLADYEKPWTSPFRKIAMCLWRNSWREPSTVSSSLMASARLSCSASQPMSWGR